MKLVFQLKMKNEILCFHKNYIQRKLLKLVMKMEGSGYNLIDVNV